MVKVKNKKLYLIALIILIIDIISKLVVSNLMLENQSIRIIDNLFYITYVRNTGVAFSLLEGNVFLIVIMTLIVIVLLVKYINSKCFNLVESIIYGFVVGGAIGNLIDRIFYGYVVDFFDVYIFGYDFPIFNVADIAIVLGIMFLLIISIKEEFGDKYEVSSR